MKKRITIVSLLCVIIFLVSQISVPASLTALGLPSEDTVPIQISHPNGTLEMVDVPVPVQAQTSQIAPSSVPVFEVVKLVDSGLPDSTAVVLTIMGDGFTASQQDVFIAAATANMEYFFKMHPFDEFKNAFNVYAIKVVSNASGVGTGGVPLDTYFGCTRGIGGIDRLIWPTKGDKVTELLDHYTPHCDNSVIIVNSTQHGGGGGAIKYPLATISNSATAHSTLVHEVGHSIGTLADEYMYSKREAPNLTHLDNATPSTVKWKPWLDLEGIGMYQLQLESGSGLSNEPWRRPHQNCMMANLGSPFCSVCATQLTKVLAGITKEGFNGQETITTHTIPSGSPRIVDYRYYGCAQLQTVTIPSSVTKIGQYAFLRCTALTKITNNATTPQNIHGNDRFNGVDRTKIELHIPQGTRAAYLVAGWTGFKQIYEIDASVNNAQIPSIHQQPVDRFVTTGGSAPLSVTAAVYDGGTLSYQWYETSTRTNTGGTPVSSGGTSATFNAPTGTAGTKYYYCLITNTNNALSGTKTATEKTVSVSVATIQKQQIPISRVRVDSWEPGTSYGTGGDYKKETLIDGRSDTFWQPRMQAGNNNSGLSQSRGEKLADIDLGAAKAVNLLEIDKSTFSTHNNFPISDVRVFTHTGTGNTFPNGGAMSAYDGTGIPLTSIEAEFVMTGWTEITANANIQGLRTSAAATQTVSVLFTEPVTARYIRLGITCHDPTHARGFTRVSQIRAYGGNAGDNAQTPTITGQPADKTVGIGEPAALTVAASVSRGVLSYQWYEVSSKTNIGGTPINGTTGATYNAPTLVSGIKHYYCAVTNTDSGATGNKTATVNSNAVTVTVNGITNYGDVNGDGVINAADITLLRRYIAATNKEAFIVANPSFNLTNADVNGDGIIDEKDVALLRRYLAATNASTVPLGS